MTEAEWLASGDADRMCYALADRIGVRQCWLFACAGYRMLPGTLESEPDRRVLEAAERQIDGEDRAEEMADYWVEARRDIRFHRLDAGQAVLRVLGTIEDEIMDAFPEEIIRLNPGGLGPALPGTPFSRTRYARLADILRDIVGNPFRPETISPDWLTPRVLSLAGAIYDERAFDRLPILGDALEEAGCDRAAILDHCRRPGEHVQGCWVLDLLLGKTDPNW